MSAEKEELFVRIPLTKKLIQEFNSEIAHKFGRVYGNIPNTVKEAIIMWIDAQKREREKKTFE